jgi:hypothetical protein
MDGCLTCKLQVINYVIAVFLFFSGFFDSFGMFGESSAGAKAAGAVMFLIGVLFGVAAAVNFIVLIKVKTVAYFVPCPLLIQINARVWFVFSFSHFRMNCIINIVLQKCARSQ